VEGRRHDVAIGDLESPFGGKELFADREDGLLWLGKALPAGIHLALRALPLLV
jgi:hypothetical protein